MYKPFVTCGDPKGDVDCRTIRRHKTSSPKIEHEMTSRRVANKLDTTPSIKPGKEKIIQNRYAEKCRDPSFFQLMEISNEAQKLNRMIDSWSTGLQYDGQSKDVAKDLLKGALDLQESLVVLHKLQGASQHMACMNRRQSEKPERGKIYENVVDGTYSNRFKDRSYMTDLQKPHFSYDGLHRNCNDELRKVIRDSLVRQNLFPNTDSEESDSASASASELPSTISSHSSAVHDERVTSSSFSPTGSKKNENEPSLVAKLMGLEEFPSKPASVTLQKQFDSEKVQNQQRPTFEIDMPKVSRGQIVDQNTIPERKTLKEVLETMHFKGLLKNNSFKEHKLQIQNSSDSHLKQRAIDDAPPIVLIRPLYVPYHKTEEPPQVPLPEDEAPKTKYILKTTELADIPPRLVDHEESSLNFCKMQQKPEAAYASTRRPGQEERPKGLKEKEVKLKEKASDKVKLPSHASHKPQKSESSEKKAKVKISNRKPPEKGVAKATTVSRVQDQSDISKLRKPESRSIMKRDQIPRQQRTHVGTMSKNTTQKVNYSKGSRKNDIKKQRSAEKTAEEKLVASPGKEEDKKKTVCHSEDQIEIRTTSAIVAELPIDDEAYACPDKIEEDCTVSEELLDDVTVLTPTCEREATRAEEAYNNICCSTTIGEGFKARTGLKYLLLRSQSFMGHAEEFFDLDVDCPLFPQTSNTCNVGIENPMLYTDCANELMEQKSVKANQTGHTLLLSCMRSSKLCVSLDKLVEEICDGIENLKTYREIPVDNASVDSLYAMIERDLRYKTMVNGMWDSGWTHGFSADEAEQVVNEIEKLVLTGLIDEVID